MWCVSVRKGFYMAVFPIAGSLINRQTAVQRALPRRNILRHRQPKDAIHNLGTKLNNSPIFQKLLANFVETIKIMNGIK